MEQTECHECGGTITAFGNVVYGHSKDCKLYASPQTIKEFEDANKEITKLKSKLKMMEISFENINNFRNQGFALHNHLKELIQKEIDYFEKRAKAATFHDAEVHWKSKIKTMKNILEQDQKDLEAMRKQ